MPEKDDDTGDQQDGLDEEQVNQDLPVEEYIDEEAPAEDSETPADGSKEESEEMAAGEDAERNDGTEPAPVDETGRESEPEEKDRMVDYLRRKKITEEKEQEFFDEIDRAETLLKENNFDDAVKIYMSLIPAAEELKWTDQVQRLKDLVFEARETEKKLQSQTKKKTFLQEKKQKETQLYDEALDLMGQASEAQKTHKYGDSVALYNKALAKLKQINATREIAIVVDAIQTVQAEEVAFNQKAIAKRKTASEEQKRLDLKEKEFTAARAATDAARQKDAEKFRAAKEKKEKEDQTLAEAFAVLDKANAALKDAGGMNFTSLEAKKERYALALGTYEEAANMFQSIGWNDEADSVKDTIIKVKKERDAGLQELTKKLAKSSKSVAEAKEPLTSPAGAAKRAKGQGTDVEAAIRKKIELQEKRDVAFSALAEAGKVLEAFEKKSTVIGGQIVKENEYLEVIRLYRKALGLFKEINWLDEAAKIEESIEIIKKKEQDFLAEKENIEAHLVQKIDAEKEATQNALDQEQAQALKRLQRDIKVRAKLDSKKKAAASTRAAIDAVLDQAMLAYKKNEWLKAEQEYEKAKALMIEQGWANEAESVSDTIRMIREKRASLELSLQKKERAIDDSGQFTRGVETLSETMEEVSEQAEAEAKGEQEDKQNKRLIQKQTEEEFYAVLASAQDYASKRLFTEAIEGYKQALELATQLNWASQINDIRDMILATEANQKAITARRAKRVAASKAEAEAAETARTSAEKAETARTSAKVAGTALTLAKKQREKETSDVAYALLDRGNAEWKEGQRDAAMATFTEAAATFEGLGWSGEREATLEQIRKIGQEIEDEKARGVKEEESERTRFAYAQIDEAEKFLRNKKPDEAVAYYEQAIQLFDDLGWEKEATMVRGLLEKVKEDAAKISTVREEFEEKTTSEQAYALLDEAKRYQQDKKIFKAVELAKQALEAFKSLGDEWTRDITQVQKFVEDLEKEKAKKEALIQKLKSGEL
jgi:hypothetical protein